MCLSLGMPNNRSRILAALIIFIVPYTSSAQVSPAQHDIDSAVAAREEFRYVDAVRYLKRAVVNDPRSSTAHLQLAFTYDAMHHPEIGMDEWAKLAVDEYEEVLRLDPSDLDAFLGLGHLYFEGARWEQALTYYKKAIVAAPLNPEPLYATAVINWTQSYQLRMAKRDELKLAVNKPLIRSAGCNAVRNMNLPRVEDGITLLKRSISLQATYEAMYYLSLLFRERAEIQCAKQSAYQADLIAAKEWENKARPMHCSKQGTGNDRSRWPVAPPPPPSWHGCSN
jgi:tetratricopeptide (TPR) repeat protein